MRRQSSMHPTRKSYPASTPIIYSTSHWFYRDYFSYSREDCSPLVFRVTYERQSITTISSLQQSSGFSQMRIFLLRKVAASSLVYLCCSLRASRSCLSSFLTFFRQTVLSLEDWGMSEDLRAEMDSICLMTLIHSIFTSALRIGKSGCLLAKTASSKYFCEQMQVSSTSYLLMFLIWQHLNRTSYILNSWEVSALCCLWKLAQDWRLLRHSSKHLAQSPNSRWIEHLLTKRSRNSALSVMCSPQLLILARMSSTVEYRSSALVKLWTLKWKLAASNACSAITSSIRTVGSFSYCFKAYCRALRLHSSPWETWPCLSLSLAAKPQTWMSRCSWFHVVACSTSFSSSSSTLGRYFMRASHLTLLSEVRCRRVCVQQWTAVEEVKESPYSMVCRDCWGAGSKLGEMKWDRQQLTFSRRQVGRIPYKVETAYIPCAFLCSYNKFKTCYKLMAGLISQLISPIKLFSIFRCLENISNLSKFEHIKGVSQMQSLMQLSDQVHSSCSESKKAPLQSRPSL